MKLNDNLRLVLMTLLVLFTTVMCFAQGTYIRHYDTPNESVTNIRTIKCSNNGLTFLMSIEGRNLITNTFFTRLQSIDLNGEPVDDYSTAYIGRPLDISSGIFDLRQYHNTIMTPTIESSPGTHKLYFKWQFGDVDNNYAVDGFTLPDSIQTILEFPSAISNNTSLVFGTESNLIAGRARVNGVNQGFLIETDYHGQVYQSIVTFPGMAHISGITKIDEGYLIIGQAGTWKGRIMLVDYQNNLVWQEDFTDGADATQVPMFTTPLLTHNYSPVVISYQDKAGKLHIAKYNSRSLQEICSLQLDGYIGAAPLIATSDSLIAFAYVKDGKQFISQIDMQGNLRWNRELPGIGMLGKECLRVTGSGENMCYLIGGRSAQGGYYLAKLDSRTGQADNDYVIKPPTFRVSYYPNPGKGNLSMDLDVIQSGKIKVEIYNIKGQKVGTLLDKSYQTGKFKTSFELANINNATLPSGIYLISAKLNNRKITQKITILK